MLKRTAAICLVVVVALFSGGIASASSGGERAALKAADFLKKQQHDDGGFGAKDSTVAETAMAIIGLKTAGVKLPKAKTGKTTIDYLAKASPALNASDAKVAVQNTAKIAYVIMALQLAGENPKKFAGVDWVRLLEQQHELATGRYGMYEIDHMWAMLAMASVGDASDEKSVQLLQLEQNEDGGYSLDKKGGMVSDTNSTALAIQALISHGVKPQDPSVKKAVDYLKTQQNKDGGFPYSMSSPYGTDSDASSTAWALQALIASGEDIESKYWVKAAVTPMGLLMSLQNASGALAYQEVVPDDSEICTAQAIPALMLKPYPIKLTAPPSTSEKLPKDNATFSTEALLLIAAGVIAAIAVVAGLGLMVFRRRNG